MRNLRIRLLVLAAFSVVLLLSGCIAISSEGTNRATIAAATQAKAGKKIIVDGSEHRIGPWPIIFYALTEPTGDDIYPLGDGAFALYGLYDSSSTSVKINDRPPPNRIAGPNWGNSDAGHLKLTDMATGNLRLNGVNTRSPEGYIPIGPTDSEHGPQIEVRNISFQPEDVDVTLIGTSVINQIVTQIDYANMVADPVTGFRSPYMNFFRPSDPAIPIADITLRLEPFGNRVDEHGKPAGQRYWLRNVLFQNNDHIVAPQPGEFNLLFATATRLTVINNDLADRLGLAALTGAFDCYGGTNNGYIIDSVTMTSSEGTYQIQHAALCHSEESITVDGAAAMIGANSFDQVQIILDGPGATVGISADKRFIVEEQAEQPASTPSVHVAGPRSETTLAEKGAALVLFNESNTPVCYAYISPVGYTGPYVDVERLHGEPIAPTESHTFDLASGSYDVYLTDCPGNMIFYRRSLDVADANELHFTDLDIQVASCQAENYTGIQLFDQGRFSEALARFHSVLGCYQKVGHRSGEGESLNNIAAVYEKQGRYAEAMDFLYKALTIAQSTGNRDGESATLNAIAAIDKNTGRLDDALNALYQVLAIRRELDDRAGEGTILNNIGTICSELGRHNEALLSYQKALENRRLMLDHLGEANTLNNIAQDYVRQERYQEALTVFEQALAIVREPGVKNRFIEGAIVKGIGLVHAYEQRFPDALKAFQDALTLMREVSDRVGEGAILASIAHVLEDLGRTDEALSTYVAALDLLESIRSLSGGEAERAGFIGQFQSVYQRAVDLYYRQGFVQEAFYLVERGRARAFLDQIGNQRVDFRRGAATELMGREETLRQKIVSLQEELNAAQLQSSSQASLETLNANLKNSHSEYEALIRRLKLENPEYVSLISVNPLTLSDIQQQLLDEESTLIEYYVMEQHSLVWVIDKGGFEIVNLPISREKLNREVEFLRDFIISGDSDTTAAAALYRILFAPLKPHLRHKNLIIIPHDTLHYLPFAALWDADSKRYLVEDYTITYGPSASALKFILSKRNQNDARLLALGNPDGSLPTTEDEVKAVVQLYGVKPLLGSQATESQVYTQSGNFDILHLATHADFNIYNSLFTTIKLGPDNINDGNLEVHEVFGMDLTGVNLVVLSACKTALGTQSNGDELVGLTRAFLYAGAPAVVTTLWSIEDEASGVLMVSFYSHLRAGMTNAEALQAAQMEVMAQEAWEAPYYWAAFSLNGDYLGGE